MAKLVIMLRVKDGIFFINEWLERYQDIADEIVALDNGSTDGTLDVLKSHPKVVQVLQTEGYNEGRDKNMVYDAVKERKADWVMWLDADEILEPGVNRKEFDRMMDSKVVDRYVFRRFHFIDREHFAGSPYWLNYSAGHDRMLWRDKPSGYFVDQLIDSPNVKGIGGVKYYTNYRLKHLGYINKALVDKKADIYRGVFKEDTPAMRTMYIHNEKKIRWVDNRRSLKVIGLNFILNLLLMKQFAQKGLKLLVKPITKAFRKSKPAVMQQAVS
ncbi:glycosyltransferase family 2 protein [Mucilaginibacter sp. RS28]|uniref:Glycosyltransferase family 2 protein n=1 Tax=Mucilaginibacter straminoryzae TaxID=2932774 RepID=A0A9X1X5Z6_9SPHI|nr:glycosyltransferase family 2 protein [Mucilaginibacter straminoryzae]MCJ8211025.1 glycosyltransferase family 2 protein [Mucilaginibacter straminoryzae]